MYLNLFCSNRSHACGDAKCISTWVYKTPTMPARTQNAFQQVLSKPLPCQPEHKMNLNKPTMPARSENASLHVLTEPLPCQRGHNMHLNICRPKSPIPCVGHTHPIQVRTENVSQNVLTEKIAWQRGQNIYKFLLTKTIPNLDSKCISTCANQTPPMQVRSQNTSLHVRNHANKKDKCISTCVDRTNPIPARTLNASQHVLLYPSLDCEETKCISTCIDQTSLMPVRTQKCNSTRVDQTRAKPARIHKMHLNMWWPNPSYGSDVTKYISACNDRTSHMPSRTDKCISTCVDPTPLMKARTKNVPNLALTKPLACQLKNKMHLNMCSPNLSHASEDTKCI
jgi:hypothetical protein